MPSLDIENFNFTNFRESFLYRIIENFKGDLTNKDNLFDQHLIQENSLFEDKIETVEKYKLINLTKTLDIKARFFGFRRTMYYKNNEAPIKKKNYGIW